MSINSRKLLMSCALALLGVQYVTAQSFEVFGGYSVSKMKPQEDANHATMNGWNSSVTVYPWYRIGLVADFAGYYGTAQPAVTVNGASTSYVSYPVVSIRQYSYMAGPQFRLIHTRHFDTSVKALFGGARGYVPVSSVPAGTTLTYNPLDESTIAMLFGSNVDVNVSKRVAIRFSPGMYLTQYGTSETQRNFRFSVGPVFRFGGKEE